MSTPVGRQRQLEASTTGLRATKDGRQALTFLGRRTCARPATPMRGCVDCGAATGGLRCTEHAAVQAQRLDREQRPCPHCLELGIRVDELHLRLTALEAAFDQLRSAVEKSLTTSTNWSQP